MKSKEVEDLVSGKFTWKIDKFSKLMNKKQYSDVFVVGGFKWRISIFPKGNHVRNYFSMYLDMPYVPPDGSTSTYAKFRLTVVNQLHSQKSKTEDFEHEFDTNKDDWGFCRFMLLSELCDHSKGYLVNDTCIIEAFISVRKGESKLLEDKDSGELMDFRGLGQIDKAFVPLLEEVCLLHPSLIECQWKRSRKFTECAFTALGQLLHFLKATKVKDMNKDACENLRLLWEELETFRFDLAWLEPHVLSVVRMKDRTERVNRIKEEVDALENEVRRRKATLVALEADLDVAKGDLAKAAEGLNEIDMDSEVGYAST